MAATTEDRVRRLIAGFLHVDVYRVVHTARLDALGADSLDLVELAMDLEDEFGCVITDEEVGGINTVQDAIAAVVRGVEREGRAL